jgi:tetraprenyl-beta-curcumene synthase
LSTTTHTNNGHAPQPALASAPAARQPPAGRLLALAEPFELPYAFADTVLRYLLLILPPATRELAHWRARATEIPNPNLRVHALDALAKRGNIEGAALLATLAPAAQRRRTVRALVAYQTAYNYLDTLSELPTSGSEANGHQLHQALLTALVPGGAHPDYYAHNPDTGDGGFLSALLDSCRRALAGLPSFDAVAPTARTAARRTLMFQTLNLSESQGGHAQLKRWASDATPPGTALQWWETAAAAGSSLAVHALIAAAAQPDLDPWDAREIDGAYFPWIGALHSLLDSLVDRNEDHDRGQRSLLGYYHSPTDAAIRLSGLAARARRAAERLPDPHANRVILTAMCSYYLSAPECRTAEGQTVTRGLTRALGLPLNLAIVMFRVRRLLHALTDRPYT